MPIIPQIKHSPLSHSRQNGSSTGHYKQPSQPATQRFGSKEMYSSIHFKGLTADPKIGYKTLHIWHILHRLHGKKKTKFDVRTLIQAYLQDEPEGAICVQNFDDSLNPAIRITYRSSQRSSSMCEPRHPLLKVAI